MDRRTFTACMLAAPIMMKANLGAFASPAAPVGSDDSLCYASVDDLMAMFRTKKASPVDLLKAVARLRSQGIPANALFIGDTYGWGSGMTDANGKLPTA